MSEADRGLKIPPSLEVVQHAGHFEQLDRFRTKDNIITFLWREESGINVTYLHVSDEPTLFKVPSDKVEDAKVHPMIYADRAGYPFEDVLEQPPQAA